jgi:PAS domain S-box-containing protein
MKIEQSIIEEIIKTFNLPNYEDAIFFVQKILELSNTSETENKNESFIHILKKLNSVYDSIILKNNPNNQTIQKEGKSNQSENLQKSFEHLNQFHSNEGVKKEEINELLESYQKNISQYKTELIQQKFALDQHAIVSITDIKGNIIYANHKFCEISGYGIDELLGNNHRLLKSGLHSDDFFKEFWLTIKTGSVWHGDICNRRKNGKLYWVNATIVPILDQSGRPYEYIGIRTDITKTKEYERNLIESELRISLILEANKDAWWDWDLVNNKIFYSERWCNMLGYSPSDFETSLDLWERFCDEESITKFKSQITEYFKSEANLYELEMKFIHKDGYLIPVLSRGIIQRDKNLNPIRILVSNMDLTERKKVEKELKNSLEKAEIANLSKSNFLATMSHEIRTPMNGIIGMTSLLLDTNLTNEQNQFVSTIRYSSEILLEIINDILDFSKLESDKLELENTEFDLEQMIEGILDLLFPKIGNKSIEISYTINSIGKSNYIISDQGRLSQVLINLGGNAIKFTNSGFVNINCKIDLNEKSIPILTIIVEDTGIGIPENAKDKMFQMFSQADASTSRKYGGTGLGLAICKRIIDKMNGNIQFESTEGVGSKFSFSLPVKLTKKNNQSTIDLSLIKLKNIALYETNSLSSKLILDYFESFDIKLQLFDRKIDFINFILNDLKLNRKIDLVIINYDSDLIETNSILHSIKDNKSIKDIKILIYSSLELSILRDLKNKQLIDDYILKPIKYTKLLLSTIGLYTDVNSKEDIILNPIINQTKFVLNILIAEDNLINQQVIKKILSKMGHKTLIANNGKEVIDLLNVRDFDLILMDMQMPIMDGIEATIQIRKMEIPKKNTIIIAMTANAMDEDREKCISSGMNDFLSKPISIELLKEKLHQYAHLLSEQKPLMLNVLNEKSINQPISTIDEISEIEKKTWIDDSIQEDLKNTIGEKVFNVLQSSFIETLKIKMEDLCFHTENENYSMVNKISKELHLSSLNIGYIVVSKFLEKIIKLSNTKSLDTKVWIEHLKKVTREKFE